jgi:TRAP-type mannitol/chloroaromatic compound transport system permease small subunit
VEIAFRLAQPLIGFAVRVDRAIDRVGRAAAWLVLPLVLLLFLQVPLRQLPVGRWATMSNDIGQLIHAVAFMTACAYALRWDRHARVDVLFRSLSSRAKAWIELIGSLVFALPWLAMLAVYSAPIVISSWRDREVFVDSWAPGYFILKSMLLVFALAMGIQTLAHAARALARLVAPGHESADGDA